MYASESGFQLSLFRDGSRDGIRARITFCLLYSISSCYFMPVVRYCSLDGDGGHNNTGRKATETARKSKAPSALSSVRIKMRILCLDKGGNKFQRTSGEQQLTGRFYTTNVCLHFHKRASTLRVSVNHVLSPNMYYFGRIRESEGIEPL